MRGVRRTSWPSSRSGVLTGRERARVLSHVESCPRCAEELEVLSRTADSVVQAAPEMEPPLGFEVRLFERMGVTDVRRRGAGASGRRAGCRPWWASPRRPWRSASGLSRVVVAVADRHGAGARARTTGRDGGPRRERQDGRARRDRRRRQAVDVDDARRFDGARDGALRRRDRRRQRRTPSGPSWPVVATARGRRRCPSTRRRAHRRGGVAQRDGDRHRHAGLTTCSSTGRCRACRGPRPGRRCSRPAPGSAS